MAADEHERTVRAMVREEIARVPFDRVAVPDRGPGGDKRNG